MEEKFQDIKKKVVPILKHAHVKRAALFGSVARGEDRPDSDIDFLVEVQRPYGLFKFLNIKLALEEILHRKVDLVEFDRLKPHMRANALKDAVEIL